MFMFANEYGKMRGKEFGISILDDSLWISIDFSQIIKRFFIKWREIKYQLEISKDFLFISPKIDGRDWMNFQKKKKEKKEQKRKLIIKK